MDIGIVTELTAGIVFCIGYMVTTIPLVAATISAIILLVLVERKRLHTLARKRFKPHEIEVAIILTIFTLGILPLLPNHTIDPWQVFNPRTFGLLITTVAAIQFTGYITIHLFGERLGIALTGFLGGFVSSTVVFAQLADKLRRHPQSTLAIVAAGLLSNVAMLTGVLILIFVASSTLLTYIMYPIITMIIIGTVLALIILRMQAHPTGSRAMTNRVSLRSILRTSCFIGFMLVMVAIANRFISVNGMMVVAFLSGLLDVRGISLATALLFAAHQLRRVDSALVLYAAILATFVSKFILLWLLTPWRFALLMSLLLLIMLGGGGMVYWLGF